MNEHFYNLLWVALFCFEVMLLVLLGIFVPPNKEEELDIRSVELEMKDCGCGILPAAHIHGKRFMEVIFEKAPDRITSATSTKILTS
jgi:hypothetical protein